MDVIRKPLTSNEEVVAAANISSEIYLAFTQSTDPDVDFDEKLAGWATDQAWRVVQNYRWFAFRNTAPAPADCSTAPGSTTP